MKLMIVDDHAGVRKLIRQMIATHDDVVRECASGDEAIQAVSDFKPDGITMDVRMAGISSFEAVRVIRTAHASVRVVMVTSYDEPFLRQAALEAGAAEFFVKENLTGLRAALMGSHLRPPAPHKNISGDDAALRERINQLEAQSRELNSFAGTIANELRGPLQAIHSSAVLLERQHRTAAAGQHRHLLSRIEESCRKLDERLSQLLALSGATRRSLKSEPVDMNQLVHTAWEEVCSENELPGVEFKVELLPEMHGDRTLLQLVFLNLLGNAVKFSKRRERPVIEVACAVTGNEAVFCTRDNGVGFDMQSVDRLFKPFNRLHPAHEFAGAGLGLVTVDRIIRRHGGRVWAEAAVNQGARFCFSLPNRAADRPE